MALPPLSLDLIENHGRNLALDGDGRDKVAQLARLRVTLNEDDAAVLLLADSNQGASLVDRELAREAAASRHLLQRRQVARGAVDGEVDEGVRDDGGAVGGVKVGDLEGVLAAGRDDEELLVGLVRWWWRLVCLAHGCFYPDAEEEGRLTETQISAAAASAGTSMPLP